MAWADVASKLHSGLTAGAPSAAGDAGFGADEGAADGGGFLANMISTSGDSEHSTRLAGATPAGDPPLLPLHAMMRRLGGTTSERSSRTPGFDPCSLPACGWGMGCSRSPLE